MPTNVLKFGHARTLLTHIRRTIASRWIQRVVSAGVIEVAGKFLIPCLIVNVWYAGDFNTLTAILVIHILEGVFVEVYRSRSKTLGSFL